MKKSVSYAKFFSGNRWWILSIPVSWGKQSYGDFHIFNIYEHIYNQNDI